MIDNPDGHTTSNGADNKPNNDVGGVDAVLPNSVRDSLEKTISSLADDGNKDAAHLAKAVDDRRDRNNQSRSLNENDVGAPAKAIDTDTERSPKAPREPQQQASTQREEDYEFKPVNNDAHNVAAAKTLTNFAKANLHTKKVEKTMRSCLVFLANSEPTKYRGDTNLWLTDAYEMAVRVHQARGELKIAPKAATQNSKPAIKPASTLGNKPSANRSVRSSIRAAIRAHR